MIQMLTSTAICNHIIVCIPNYSDWTHSQLFSWSNISWGVQSPEIWHHVSQYIYTQVPEKFAASTFRENHFSWTTRMMGAASTSKTLICTIYKVNISQKTETFFSTAMIISNVTELSKLVWMNSLYLLRCYITQQEDTLLRLLNPEDGGIMLLQNGC